MKRRTTPGPLAVETNCCHKWFKQIDSLMATEMISNRQVSLPIDREPVAVGNLVFELTCAVRQHCDATGKPLPEEKVFTHLERLLNSNK